MNISMEYHQMYIKMLVISMIISQLIFSIFKRIQYTQKTLFKEIYWNFLVQIESSNLKHPTYTLLLERTFS